MDLSDKVSTELRERIENPHRGALKSTTRAAIRSHQMIAPAAAMTNRTLALEVLTTNRGNIMCPYHQEMDKRAPAQDSKYKVTGVPMPRMVAESKKEARKDAEFRKRIDTGYLHCGCQMDAALWDFYFWKSLTLTASIDGEDVTEPVPRWTPRDRAFMLKIFEDYSFLTVNDLYTRGLSPEDHKEQRLRAQVNRILESLNELREKRGCEVLRLVEGPDSDESDGEADSALSE